MDKFTVHDKLPDTKAAQVKYFDTGLWSKKYNFKVAYTTNMHTAYTYLPGVYTSDKHHHIDLYAKNMGLRNGEYVTQVKLDPERYYPDLVDGSNVYANDGGTHYAKKPVSIYQLCRCNRQMA